MMRDLFDLRTILITGPARSGTTLLNGLISGGSAYPMLPECSVITYLFSNATNILNYTDAHRLKAFIRDEDHLMSLYSGMVLKLIEDLVDSFEQERQYLVLKDPAILPFIRTIPKIFGDKAKIICCVRDPRDIIASLIEVYRRDGGTKGFNEAIEETSNSFYHLGKGLDENSSNISALLVRYEDIVRGVPQVFEILEAFCGYKIREKEYGERVYEFDKSSPFYVENYGSPANASRIATYRSILDDKEINEVERLFAGPMMRFGYS